MEITIHVVVEGNKATVYAVASPLPTTGKKDVPVKAVVMFSVDGVRRKPCTTDEAGLVTFELENMKIGNHTVRATVLGQNPIVEAEEGFEIAEKVAKPTGKIGCAMMVIFWLALWYFGPGWLTITYLAVTFGVMTLIAKLTGRQFRDLASNNNWVFWAMLSMTVLTGFIASLNPLVPQGIGGWLKSLFAGETELSDSVFWGLLNGFFFGESFTFGWSDTTWLYAFWIVPAFAVSFWDEVGAFLVKLFKHLSKGEGLATFALKDGLMELLWSVFKRSK